MCARCGRFVDGGSRHHRKLRRFGDHSVQNLVLLCGSGTTGCHGWAHSRVAEAFAIGMLVHSWHDPASVPVLYRLRWVLFTPEGDTMTLTDEQALERRRDLGLVA